MSRILVLILCLSLLCIYVPMTAMADEEEDYEIPGSEDIAKEEAAPPAGTAVIVENVVIRETSNL